MDIKCVICEKRKGYKCLTDKELNICEKLEEIFSLKLGDFGDFSNLVICKACLANVNSSYQFYNQVKAARDRLRQQDETILIKMEIKEEISENVTENFDLEDFSIFNDAFAIPLSYEAENDESSEEKAQLKVIIDFVRLCDQENELLNKFFFVI